MSQKIAFAVRCSIAVLQSLVEEEPSEGQIAHPPSLPLKGWLYLWTFTTPDVVSLAVISERWTLLNKRLSNRKSGVRWMRFFEPHISHGWHVHTVAATRYDVTTIRKLAEKFGFGRLNVIRIPASAAGYVLKYVTKYKRHSSDGRFRMWACNGFKGVTVSRVRVFDTWADYCYSQVGYKEVPNWSLDYIYRNGLEAWAKQTRIGDAQQKTKNKMNAVQSKKAAELLETGAKVVFVEYRGNKIREARKFIDGRASLSEKTYYNQFLLEAGGAPLLIEAQLPDTYRPTDTVVPPMKKGQTCVLEITKVSVFNSKETYQGNFHAIA